MSEKKRLGKQSESRPELEPTVFDQALDTCRAIEDLTADLLDVDVGTGVNHSDLQREISADLLATLRSIAKDRHETITLEVGNSSSESSDDSGNGRVRPKREAKGKAKPKKGARRARGDPIEPVCNISGLLNALQLAVPDAMTTEDVPGMVLKTMRVVTNNASSSAHANPKVLLAEITIAENSDERVSIVARCSIHRECKCWINVRRSDYSYDQIMESLMGWTSTARALTPGYHELHSVQMRESFGVKPRGRNKSAK